MVSVKKYPEPPICEKEILRYAGCKSFVRESLQFSVALQSEQEVESVLSECIEEVRTRLTYKVCHIELPVSITKDCCDFGCMKVDSKDLAKNLQGCEKVILFGATIGVEIDRLITKYGRVSPVKALLFQAIGAERIEALCDLFCEEIQTKLWGKRESGKKVTLHPRFSPGYGDLPLEIQKDIFQILDCSKQIGLSLNDSLLMSPSKSVTAFVGLRELGDTKGTVNISGQTDVKQKRTKCVTCNNIECAYREI